MNGNGCGGIDRERRQDREDVGDEALGEPVALGVGQLRRIDARRCRLARSSSRSVRQPSCWSCISADARRWIAASCCGRRQAVAARAS